MTHASPRSFPTDPSEASGVEPQDLVVDPRSRERVTALADRIARGAGSPLRTATKIQDYLRDPSRFTYSLKLAPAREGPDGKRLDPISHFLATQRGYCTQFASAMIMMARSQGIPARMAIGFLPGLEDPNGLYTVTAANAHAWPELYLPDLGWTRFEPTPGVRSGEAPALTDTSTDSAAPGGSPAPRDGMQPRTAPNPVTGVHQPDRPEDVVPSTTGVAGESWWSRAPVALGILLLGLAGALVLPLAGRHRRESPTRRARDDADRVEAQWAAFGSRMSDYGIPHPGGRTPRQLERYYEVQAALDEDSEKALARVLQTLERSRYAAPSGERLTIGADTRTVLHAVTTTRSWRTRLGAVLWPRSGRAQLRSWLGGATRSVGRPGRAVGERVDSWEAQQRTGRSGRASHTRKR